MNWNEIISSIGIGTLLGTIVGGALGAYFQSLYQHWRLLKEKELEWKMSRYKPISILLIAKLRGEEELRFLTKHRPEITSIELLDRELETEFLNASLFASNKVVKYFSLFLSTPSYKNYNNLINALRNDLWGWSILRSKINLDQHEI